MLTEQQIANRKKFVAALRSGKYKQTRWRYFNRTWWNYLPFVNTCEMCSLGLAYYVTRNTIWPTSANVRDEIREDYGFSGLETGDIIYFNDTKNHSFAQIANYVESLTPEEDEKNAVRDI